MGERLTLPAGNESEEYDGDESELSRSVVKRGRRSIKKKQPPKGGVALFGGADLIGKGKNPFAHRQRDDSDEKKPNGRGLSSQQMIRQMMKSRWWSHSRLWNNGLQKWSGKSARLSKERSSTIRSLMLCCGKLRRRWKKRNRSVTKRDPILQILAPRCGKSKKTKRLRLFKGCS